MRKKLLGVLVLVGLLVPLFSLHAASAGQPYITRYRLDLWGSSDFQDLNIQNTWLASHHISSVIGGTISRGQRGIRLNGPGSTSANLLFEAGQNESFTIALAKAANGEAHARLYRTNLGTNILVASLDNYMGAPSTTTVYKTISRSAFVAEGLTIPRVDPRRLVLAWYYPWFQEGSFDQGPWYDKPLNPWRTEDAAEVSAMVTQAADAGVDGFIVAWNTLPERIRRWDLVMSAAAGKPFYVAPVIELQQFETSPDTWNVAGIKDTILEALEYSSSPNFLRVGASPVVYIFGVWHMGSTVWNQVAASVTAAGHTPFFLGETSDPAYGFQGNYIYSPNGHGLEWMKSTYMARQRASRYTAQVDPTRPQQLWAATASPGMNLSYFSPLFPENEARRNGQRFADTWSASIYSMPEWVLITSWNEWYEATHIAPSEEFGYTALNVNRSWASYFHNPTQGGGSSGGGGGLIDLPLGLRRIG